jgi:hypothetical protein
MPDLLFSTNEACMPNGWKKPQQIVTQHILTTKVFVWLLNISKALEDWPA